LPGADRLLLLLFLLQFQVKKINGFLYSSILPTYSTVPRTNGSIRKSSFTNSANNRSLISSAPVPFEMGSGGAVNAPRTVHREATLDTPDAQKLLALVKPSVYMSHVMWVDNFTFVQQGAAGQTRSSLPLNPALNRGASLQTGTVTLSFSNTTQPERPLSAQARATMHAKALITAAGGLQKRDPNCPGIEMPFTSAGKQRHWVVSTWFSCVTQNGLCIQTLKRMSSLLWLAKHSGAKYLLAMTMTAMS
jgi:hypothetical protein